MAFLSNALEGTNTTVITTANSTGGGDSLGTVVGSPTYSTEQHAHGLSSMKIVEGGTGASMYAGFTGLGVADGGTTYIRFNFWTPAAPSVSAGLVRFTTSASALSARMQINTTPAVNFVNAASAGAGATGTAFPTSQWVRIEARVKHSTTAGEIEWRLWNSIDSTGTADQTVIGTTATALGAGCDQIWFGAMSPFNINSSWYLDDIAYSDVGWIGPAAQTLKGDARNTTNWTLGGSAISATAA